MSSVIKFRVFDRVSRQMSPPFSLFGEFTMLGAVFAWLDHVRGLPGGSCSIAQLNEIDTAQFTGLHDVNGVEIYDGDLIKSSSRESPYDTLAVYRVVYDAVIGMFVGHFEKAMMLAQPEFNHSLCELRFAAKVIGNIYQNPELLERAK